MLNPAMSIGQMTADRIMERCNSNEMPTLATGNLPM